MPTDCQKYSSACRKPERELVKDLIRARQVY